MSHEVLHCLGRNTIQAAAGCACRRLQDLSDPQKPDGPPDAYYPPRRCRTEEANRRNLRPRNRFRRIRRGTLKHVYLTAVNAGDRYLEGYADLAHPAVCQSAEAGDQHGAVVETLRTGGGRGWRSRPRIRVAPRPSPRAPPRGRSGRNRPDGHGRRRRILARRRARRRPRRRSRGLPTGPEARK